MRRRPFPSGPAARPRRRRTRRVEGVISRGARGVRDRRRGDRRASPRPRDPRASPVTRRSGTPATARARRGAAARRARGPSRAPPPPPPPARPRREDTARGARRATRATLAPRGVDRVGASRPWGSNSGLGGTPGRSRITSSPSAPPALPPPPAVVSAPLGDAAHTKHVQFRHASNTLEFGSVGARGPSKPRERPSCIIFACTR